MNCKFLSIIIIMQRQQKKKNINEYISVSYGYARLLIYINTICNFVAVCYELVSVHVFVL